MRIFTINYHDALARGGSDWSSIAVEGVGSAAEEIRYRDGLLERLACEIL